MIYYIQCHASWNIRSLYYKVPLHFSKLFGSRCTMNHYCNGRLIWKFASGWAPVTKIKKIKWVVRFISLQNKQIDVSLPVEDERHYSIIVILLYILISWMSSSVLILADTSRCTCGRSMHSFSSLLIVKLIR